MGRPKGSLNKTTTAARVMFASAADGIGGLAALTAWAKKNPDEFWKLYARLIPVEHTGEGGTGPVQAIVKHVYEDSKSQNPQ